MRKALLVAALLFLPLQACAAENAPVQQVAPPVPEPEAMYEGLPKYSVPDPKVWPLAPMTVPEKKQILKTVLTLRPPPFDGGFDRQVCTEILDGLRDGSPDVEILEPLFVTQNMNDPRMQKVIGHCPDLHLDTKWFFRNPEDAAAAHKLPKGKAWDDYADRADATANFTLYKLDPTLSGGG
nr:hypothetical protein [Pseudomonadota bacterium]